MATKAKKNKIGSGQAAPLVADARSISVAPEAPVSSGPSPRRAPIKAESREDAPLKAGNGAPDDKGGDGIVRQACTDVLCLVLFFAFLGVMGWLSQYAYLHGDIAKLTHGIDWTGQVCGVSENVSNQPYLFWCGNGSYTDITRTEGDETIVLMRIPVSLNLETPICVESCPRSSDDTVYCPSLSNVTRTISGEPPEITVRTVMEQEVKGQAGYATMARAGKYCLPDAVYNDNVSSSMAAKAALEALNDQIHEWVGSSWATVVITAVGNLWYDLPNILPLLCIICAGAFVLSFNYLLVLRWLAKPLIYFIIGVVALSFLATGAAFITTAHNLLTEQNQSPVFEYIKDPQTAVIVSDVIGGICAALGLILIIVTCCMHETIEMVCGCVEAACECMFDMPTLLLEPVLGAALKLTILCGLLYGLICLVSVGDVQSSSISLGDVEVNGLHRELSFTEDERNYLLVYLFGVIWIMEMCDACQQFVISYAVVLWYYKPIAPDGDKKSPWFPVIRGVYNAFVFHLGSLAMGALLVAAVRVVQLVVWIFKRAATNQGNKLCECIASCLLCCLECFRKSMEYINKMAYVDVAVHSNSFCKAASKVFKFITSEAPAIALLNSWTWIVQVGGILSISSAGGYGTYLLVRRVDRWSDPLSDHYVSEPVLLSVVAAGFCLTVSSVFMWIFDQCVDTLLYIFADNRKNRPSTVHIYAPPTLANVVDRCEESNHDLAKPVRRTTDADESDSD